MTDLQQIKKRIFEEEKIEELLEMMNCDFIGTEQGGSLYTASLPDGSNRRSVQIKNNKDLNSDIRSRGINGDIFTIVSYIVNNIEGKEDINKDLPRSKQWICEKLGYLEFIDEFYKETMYNYDEKPVPEYNSWLKKIQFKENSVQENEILDEETLNKYQIIPFYGWLKEGISSRTQREFQVGIDVYSDRIIFPVHNRYGELIGVKGRYCGDNKKIEDMYKYIYLDPCNKSIEFFNYHRAIPYITKYKEVIVVEGAKTVMILHTWGYKNVISIEGDSMSDRQINILKELGLDIKIIFAWDKDKDLEYVKKEVSRIHGRQRYAIADIENYLEEKDSPTDKGKSVWERLYNENSYRIQ